MTVDLKKLAPAQKEALAADMSRRGVKFLPSQAARRVVDPEAAKLAPLSATVRMKAKRAANRAAADKQAAAQKEKAAIPAAEKAPKPEKAKK